MDLSAEDRGESVFGERYDEQSFGDEVDYLLSVPEDAETLSASPKYASLPRGYMRSLSWQQSQEYMYVKVKREWASDEVQSLSFRDSWDWMISAMGKGQRAHEASQSKL